MSYIKVFKANEREYERLEVAAAIMTVKSKNCWHYYVGETYFDFGQDWKWTTILCRTERDTYQALTPRDQQDIITAENVEKAVDEVFEREFCPDK